MSLVSVLLPVYNNEEDVISAIKSIQRQTYQTWELIIIDDNSTDKSYKICEDYTKNDSRVKLIQNKKNLGVYVSLNEGLLIARGVYITFIGSDDTFHPDNLLKQVTVLDFDPKIMATNYLYVRENSEPLQRDNIMYRKIVIDKMGYYDSVRFGADSEFRERIIAIFGKQSIKIIDQVLYYAKIRDDSLTRSTITGSRTIRIEYVKNYKEWHKNTSLFMPYPLFKRPFLINDIMLP